MRAVVCQAFGPPEALVVEEMDDPIAGDGQLLIDVKHRLSHQNFP
jgi:NADPH2:quinone reductase